MVRAPGNCTHIAVSTAHTMPRYTQHQHHMSFVVWIKASRMYCSVIKAFDHRIKSIKILYSSSFPHLQQMLFQGMAGRRHFPAPCIACFWGALGGGCCLVVWSSPPPVFWGLLTNSYGSQMFMFGQNLIVFFFFMTPLIEAISTQPTGKMDFSS